MAKKSVTKKTATKKSVTKNNPNKQPNRKRNGRAPNNHKVQLSTPWGGENISNVYQTIKTSSDTSLSDFITERTALHKSYIEELEKTKRLWLILSVIAMISALAIIVFAPEGRETLSYWIGGALLVFAAGAAGYKRVWGKSKVFSLGADQDQDTNKLDQ